MIYFYTALLATCKGDMSHHVCETGNLRVSGNTRNAKTLTTMVQIIGAHTLVPPEPDENELDDGEYTCNAMTLEDLASRRTEARKTIDPFKIRLSKTGMCVCVLCVCPLKM